LPAAAVESPYFTFSFPAAAVEFPYFTLSFPYREGKSFHPNDTGANVKKLCHTYILFLVKSRSNPSLVHSDYKSNGRANAIVINIYILSDNLRVYEYNHRYIFCFHL
jgi:hypothetical protein